MKSILRILAVFAGVLHSGCGPIVNENEISRIVVKEDGALFVNGELSKVEDLGPILDDLRQRKGVAWYYRSNPEGEPNEKAKQTMDVLIASGVPVKLFVKEDFSEYISAEGALKKQRPQGPFPVSSRSPSPTNEP